MLRDFTYSTNLLHKRLIYSGDFLCFFKYFANSLIVTYLLWLSSYVYQINLDKTYSDTAIFVRIVELA